MSHGELGVQSSQRKAWIGRSTGAIIGRVAIAAARTTGARCSQIA
jgi:hypothetical protein